jgi:type IV pilus assembly protein PilW
MKPTHSNLSFRQRGVTLIELLISVAIGLVLSAVAAYVYQSVQTSSRNLEAQALRNESATIIFDIVGRDLRQSGFFPVHFGSPSNPSFKGQFVDVLEGSAVLSTPAFRQAIFGCSNATFNTANGLCNPPTAGNPDSMVINHFTADTFANSWQGTRRDCLGDTIENAQFSGVTYNKLRASLTEADPLPTTTVAAPLLVQNVFSLSGVQTVSYYVGSNVATRSISCDGNNFNSVGESLVQGIEQMRILYGVFDPAIGFSAAQFLTADQVSALPPKTIQDPRTLATTTKSGWAFISSVEMCILTKTLDPSARLSNGSGSYTNCDGVTVTPAAGDRAIYKLQTRRFAIRNNINIAYGYE